MSNPGIWRRNASRPGAFRPKTSAHSVIVRPDGSALYRLTRSPGDAHASWSPDGTGLIFASAQMGFKDERAVGKDHQPYGEILTVRADGTGLRQLTDDKFEEGAAAWINQDR